MIRIVIRTAFAATGAIACIAASAQGWSIDPEATQIHWEGRHFDTSTSRGRFERIEARLDFDAAARRGDLAVRVATASVTTGLPPFDTLLRGNAMLDSRIHPEATFVSRRFEFQGDRLVAVQGDMTVKDITRPLTLKAIRFACRAGTPPAIEVCGGDFEGEFRRSDYAINYGSPFAADRIRLFVSVQARRR